MKKTSLIVLLFLATALPAFAAQDTAYCQQLYGSNFAWDASKAACVNTTISPNQTGSTGPVSCSTPGADPATCIPSGSGTIPTTPTTPATPTTNASNTTCPNGQPPKQTTVNGVQVNQGCDLGYTPLEPIPGLTTDANGQLDFPHLLGNLYKIIITLGALFSVLMLTISGIRYMLSDVVTDKAKAIQRIKACIYALILIAASWLILNTINPKLLIFSLQPCPQTSAGCNIPSSAPANTTLAPAPGSQLPAQQVVAATKAESAVNSQVVTQPGTDTALTLTVPVNCGAADNVLACLSEVRDKTNAFNTQCAGVGGKPQPVSGAATGGLSTESVYICKI